MRRAWRAADRAAGIREAAQGWHAAGLVEASVLDALVAEHPAAGPQLGWTWRSLVFLCVLLGVSTSTALGFISFEVRGEGEAALALGIAGLALAALTDFVIERCAFRPTGAEAATSLLAASYLSAAAFLLNDLYHLRGPEAHRFAYAWCAAVFGLAAWRWGFRLYAGAAAGFVLLLAAQFPGARLLWIAVAALLAAGAGRALATRDLSPSHRGGVELARFVALAAVYLAVNYYSADQGLLEEIGRAAGAPRHRPSGLGLALAGLGSAVVPLGFLAWGLRTRDRGLIGLGVVATALSLATIRFYHHVAPLWLVLVASGAALACGSLLLERLLRSGRDGERAGFTAAPLYGEERRERLLPVATALALAPAARALPEEPRGPSGSGGAFGGGGAGGTYG